MFILKNKRLFGIIFGVFLLLLIPLIATPLTEEVSWDPGDFIVAGGLLLGTGLLIELVLRIVRNVNHRIFIALSILLLLILVWMELAVGIFGSPISGS